MTALKFFQQKTAPMKNSKWKIRYLPFFKNHIYLLCILQISETFPRKLFREKTACTKNSAKSPALWIMPVASIQPEPQLLQKRLRLHKKKSWIKILRISYPHPQVQCQIPRQKSFETTAEINFCLIRVEIFCFFLVCEWITKFQDWKFKVEGTFPYTWQVAHEKKATFS